MKSEANISLLLLICYGLLAIYSNICLILDLCYPSFYHCYLKFYAISYNKKNNFFLNHFF